MASRPSNHHFSSASSTSSSDSDTSSSSYRHSMDSVMRPVASVEVLRCLRCARSVETTSTDDPATQGMVRIGHNIYYCTRCAKMVGYK
ncbi:hypothetical protein SCAR479_07714 [Seiridium cardinale]|uniref:Uncharacterized protein n=1 Tax=Seiridium cardinale TaxID=138064 RepID=A0ABR2XP71_9PEZI